MKKYIFSGITLGNGVKYELCPICLKNMDIKFFRRIYNPFLGFLGSDGICENNPFLIDFGKDPHGVRSAKDRL